MNRSVTIKLSQFALDALVRGSQVGSRLVSAKIEEAVRCYLRDRDAGRHGWPYPEALLKEGAREGVELELSIDNELWSCLEEEAVKQGVSVEALSEHAVLYFAAEVDAGRITQRILDDFEADGPGTET